MGNYYILCIIGLVIRIVWAMRPCYAIGPGLLVYSYRSMVIGPPRVVPSNKDNTSVQSKDSSLHVLNKCMYSLYTHYTHNRRK